jgi:hypothetical protein
MDRDQLRKRFIVGADVLKERLEAIINKALSHCVVTENGTVYISSKSLSAKDQIKLVLAARSLAAQLDDGIAADVSVSDLAASTGLAVNQVRARANDVVKERFATSPKRGFFTANAHKIEAFLDSLGSESRVPSGT